MTPSDNPRVFHGPPLPLDSPLVSGPAVAFAAEEQSRDGQEGAAMTPFERFIGRLMSQAKQGRTFTSAELHRLMGVFAATECVRFTPDEVDGVTSVFSSHDHEVAPATVTFSTSTGAQPRDDQGRYQEQPRDTDARGRYRGKDLTPEYRQQLLAASPIGRQILKDEAVAGTQAVSVGGTGSKAGMNDYQQQAFVYARLWRQIVEDEATTQARR